MLMNYIPENQQWKHQNNVWNVFKVSNKKIRITSVFFGAFVKFELISHIILLFPLFEQVLADWN